MTTHSLPVMCTRYIGTSVLQALYQDILVLLPGLLFSVSNDQHRASPADGVPLPCVIMIIDGGLHSGHQQEDDHHSGNTCTSGIINLTPYSSLYVAKSHELHEILEQFYRLLL